MIQGKEVIVGGGYSKVRLVLKWSFDVGQCVFCPQKNTTQTFNLVWTISIQFIKVIESKCQFSIVFTFISQILLYLEV